MEEQAVSKQTSFLLFALHVPKNVAPTKCSHSLLFLIGEDTCLLIAYPENPKRDSHGTSLPCPVLGHSSWGHCPTGLGP